MRPFLLLFINFLVVLVTLTIPIKSLACSCRFDREFITVGMKEGHVFEGSVECIIYDKETISQIVGRPIYLIKVERYWGEPVGHYELISNDESGSSCNTAFSINQRIIVSSKKNDFSIFPINMCNAKLSTQIPTEILDRHQSVEVKVDHTNFNQKLPCQTQSARENNFIAQEQQLKDLALQRILFQSIFLFIILFTSVSFTSKLKNIALKSILKSIIYSSITGLSITIMLLLYRFDEATTRLISTHVFSINWLLLQNLTFSALLVVITLPAILVSITKLGQLPVLRFLSYFLLPGALLTYCSYFYIKETYDSLHVFLLITQFLIIQILFVGFLAYYYIKTPPRPLSEN